MSKDLRDFIAELQADAPVEIVEIDVQIDPTWEATAIARKYQERGEYPMLLYNEVEGSEYRLVTNVHASRRKLAFGIMSPDTPETELRERFTELTSEPCSPKTVSSNDAPTKQNVKIGEEADLTELPLVKHNEFDSGRFVDAGVVFVKDPETGSYNSGIYRCQLHGPRQLGILAAPGQDLDRIIRKTWELGQSAEVALTIGTHPIVTLGATAHASRDAPEIALMSSIAKQATGEPLEVVACETVDLEVPAHAEFVLEGEIPVDTYREEGPFGEYPWTYGEARMGRVIDIKAITHRDDPIYETIFAGHPDHNLCGVLGAEGELYRKLKQIVPVTDVRLPLHGCCRFTAYVAIDKEDDGEGHQAVLAALGADKFIKNVIVVDEDVDIYNDSEVLYAMWTRTHMDTDAVIVPNSLTEHLVPSTYSQAQLERSRMDMDEEIAHREDRANPFVLDVKFGVDATRPVTTQWPIRPEPENWESIDLSKYASDRVAAPPTAPGDD